MVEIFGIPSQALLGQLLIGLINGSFYALLSFGLAVIFGMLNIINFTHGTQYMMGAFAAYIAAAISRPQLLGGALVVPILVGAAGSSSPAVPADGAEARSSLRFDPDLRSGPHHRGPVSQLLWVLRRAVSASGPLQGGHNLGFMFLPNYRAWVIVFSLAVCLATWFASNGPASVPICVPRPNSRPRPRLRHQCAAHGDSHIRLRRGAGGARRRDGGADLQVSPQMGPTSSSSCSRSWSSAAWARSSARS